jgi:hypothetical protein
MYFQETSSQAPVLQEVQLYLEEQLGDADLARQLAEVVQEQVLTWTAPSTDLVNVGAIVACSFGYRRLDNGNIIPGPMNERLAEVVVELYNEVQCHVYAQWEIAESIEKVPLRKLHSIYPDINPKDATIGYLSTRGVMLKVRELVQGAESLGKVLIVAYRDHAPRCVRIARKLGFDAFVPPRELPNEYDSESGQAWTRNRRAYIVHDILSRLEAYRAEVIGTFSPSSRLD